MDQVSKHLKFMPVHFHLLQLEASFSTTLSLKLGNSFPLLKVTEGVTIPWD